MDKPGELIEMTEEPELAPSLEDSLEVLELNVGGVYYSTSLATVTRVAEGYLAKLFSESNRKKLVKDSKGKYFIDRDGVLFRYILDYLRNLKLILPENFHEKERLRQEAEHFKLPALVQVISSFCAGRRSLHNVPSPNAEGCRDPPAICKHLTPQSSISSTSSSCKPNTAGELVLPSNNSDHPVSGRSSPARTPLGDRGPGYITIGYRGTFAFGRDGMSDVKFRKLSRIIVCGKVSLCRDVFKNTLNESRDPDRGDYDRYTSRFFLKHTFLEQAFDMLQEEGFSLVASCGSGTNSAGEVKAGLDTEEAKWQHYNEFIFERR